MLQVQCIPPMEWATVSRLVLKDWLSNTDSYIHDSLCYFFLLD